MFHILFQKFNYFYESLFEKWGRFLAKYHIYVIIFVILLNTFLGFFIFRMEMITNSDVLFMPTDGEARLDEKHIKELFNSSYYLSNNFYMHQLLDLGTYGEIIFQTCETDSQTNIQDNILQEKYINEIRMVNDYVLENTFVTINESTFGFNDVCAKRNGRCLIDGEDLLSKDFYVEWLYDSMLKKTRIITEQEDIKGLNTESDEPESRSFQNEFNMYIKIGGGLTELSYTLGKDFYVNSYNESLNGSVPAYAKSLKLRYNLKSEVENIENLVKLWEIEFIKNIQKITKQTHQKQNDTFSNRNVNTLCLGNNILKIDYSVSQSLDTEIEANAQLDTTLISGTFVLIIIFAIALMSLNTTWITSPGILLPMAGILSAMFGLVSGFGFLAMIGYKGCSLIFVIPYLLIGIGIDDMFIIYASFKYAYDHRKKKCEGSDEEIGNLIGETMLKSGVSITITSITDFVAFIVGLTTGFISVQIFCVYAAVSIGFCYFYQCTLFCSVLCLHSKRMEKNRNAILFCVDQKKLNCLSICVSNDLSNDEETMKPNNGELANLNDLNAIEMEKKSISKTKKSKNQNESPIKKFLKKIFKFLICTKIGKLVSTIFYIIYISSALFAALQIREGINLGDLVSEDSYYKHYITEAQRLTNLYPVVMMYIHEPIDYDNVQVRMKIKNLVKNAQKIDGISKTFSINWLAAFSHNKLKYKKSPEYLISSLKSFPPFMNDVILRKIEKNIETNKTTSNLYLNLNDNDLMKKPIDSNKTNVVYEIAASRFYLQYDRLCLCSKDAEQMHLLRKLCNESGLPITAYSVTFKFYEQFEQTLPNVVQSFIIAVEAMYLISLIFIPDLVSVFCIIFSMISIMTGLLGGMHLWGLSLSSITMIELIMSIGFCVDFSAHVTHAFIACVGKGTRNERAYKACVRMGFPIFNSAISTIGGCLLLSLCRSYIFLSFFKTILILMTLGIFNSLLFLPVLLSIVGPDWPRHKKKNTLNSEQNENHNEYKRECISHLDKSQD